MFLNGEQMPGKINSLFQQWRCSILFLHHQWHAHYVLVKKQFFKKWSIDFNRITSTCSFDIRTVYIVFNRLNSDQKPNSYLILNEKLILCNIKI